MMRDISLHIMDIMQNSTRAEANNIGLMLEIDREKDILYVTISDDGCGMSEDFISKVISPFTTTRTTRNIGLGIPMFKLSGEICGGGFDIKSKVGEGTSITAFYIISNIDRLPLGDIGDTLTGTIMSYPELRYKLELLGGNEDFIFDTDEIKKQLGDVPLTEFEVVNWMKEYINENVVSAFRGILKEVG